MLSLLPLLWIGALAVLVVLPGADATPRRQAGRLVAAGVFVRIVLLLPAGAPERPWPFMWPVIGTLACDLAVMAVLIGMLRLRRLDLRWALLHAANPASLSMIRHADLPAAAGVLTAAVLLFGLDWIRLKFNRNWLDPVTVYLVVFCLWQIGTQDFDPGAVYSTVPLAVLQPGVLTALFYLFVAFFIAISPVASPMPAVVPGLLWVPLYMQLLMDLGRVCRSRAGGFRQAPCCSVSVVVPALNEADRIEQTIRSARTDPAVREVIVADGGSTDGTATIAEALGARVIVHARPVHDGGGRGGQIRAGVTAATGDVIAVVHADTVVGAPAFSQMLEVLDRNPDVPGGAVGCRFDAAGSFFRLIDWANAVRMAYFGIGFGDQVQFFRRKPVARLNLFPPLPLMEDVELSMRLNRFGRCVYLFGGARVSTRGWSARGYGNAVTVIRLFAVYLFQRIWKQPDAVAMYRRYYRLSDSKKSKG